MGDVRPDVRLAPSSELLCGHLEVFGEGFGRLVNDLGKHDILLLLVERKSQLSDEKRTPLKVVFHHNTPRSPE